MAVCVESYTATRASCPGERVIFQAMLACATRATFACSVDGASTTTDCEAEAAAHFACRLRVGGAGDRSAGLPLVKGGSGGGAAEDGEAAEVDVHQDVCGRIWAAMH